MLSPSRPLGRLSFLFAVSGLNTVLALAVLIAFSFLPSGGGHVAVLIVVGALQYLWFVLHARRFTDAGRGAGWPLLAALLCAVSFALGYLLFASLWSVPAVQEEAFRTGGQISGGIVRHIETSPLLLGLGRELAGLLGVAGAMVVSGLILTVLGLVALASGVFSCVAFILPSGAGLSAAPATLPPPRTMQALAEDLVQRLSTFRGKLRKP